MDLIPVHVAQAASQGDLQAFAPRKETLPVEDEGDDAAVAKVDVADGGGGDSADDGGRDKLAEKQRRAAAERRIAARDAAAPYREAAMQRQALEPQVEDADETALPTSDEPKELVPEQTSLPRDPRGEVSPEEKEDASALPQPTSSVPVALSPEVDNAAAPLSSMPAE